MNRSIRQAVRLLKQARSGAYSLAQSQIDQAIALILPPKASPKAKAFKRARSARKVAKSAAGAMTTGAIRAACMKLAGGFCECGCGRPIYEERYLYVPELDHFFGRVGPQSVATCWILIRLCHRQKTHNDPDTATWNTRFVARCVRHGLPVPKALRVEHAKVPAPQAPESLPERIAK